MTHLLIIEDRKDFIEILKDWVEAKLPDREVWLIEHCPFADPTHCESMIKASDVVIFSISADNNNHFKYFKKLYTNGKFNGKRVFLISDIRTPELPYKDEVEIHTCLENNFVDHCLDALIDGQPI